MKPYILRRIIDIVTLRRTLLSCLFLTLTFFLSQIAALGKGQELVKYLNRIQESNPDGLVYHFTQIIKILYADGNIITVIISGVLLSMFIYIVSFKDIPFENLEIFKTKIAATKKLGKGKEFRYAQDNLDSVISNDSEAIGRT